MEQEKKYEIKKERNSNLELFRIISMLLIIAHHYVVNSGLMDLIMIEPLKSNSIFLLLFGAWGKTAINCFVLISGYFMCKSKITLKKFARLLMEVMLYRIVIYILFLIVDYEHITLNGVFKTIVPVYIISLGFTPCYLMFYLCIPFLNILLNNLDERKHLYLLSLLGFVYVFLETIPKFSVTINYFSWFIVLYFIASYIRIYPKKIFDSKKLWMALSSIFIILSITSIIGCLWIGNKMNRFMPYEFVTDSNTFLALGTGLSLFMLFKNINIKYNKIINTVASATFGVLLIHANSDTMRQWLWIDTLKNYKYFDSDFLILHAVCSVLIVYVVCTAIDLIRMKFIEKPVFRIWDKYEPKIVNKYKKIEEKVLTKISTKGE